MDNLLEYTGANTSFSKALPGMQLAIDSTSLGLFKTCPRKYYYEIIRGFQSTRPAIDLEFGIWYHGALERYDHARASGREHDDALDVALDWVLKQTWSKILGRPWISDNPNKNRSTLIRTVVDYLDRFGPNDSMETVILANGKPAVELSFRYFSGIKLDSTAESITFCGHLDRLAMMNGECYVVDRKTTKHTLGADWFRQFSPHNQFSMYLLASQVAFAVPAKGLIVDGAQIAVEFTRFERGIVFRDDSQLREWHRDTGFWVRTMEQCAVAEYWPQNDSSCDKYGGCQFRSICSKSPSGREQWLGSEFRRRIWDPLIARGDV